MVSSPYGVRFAFALAVHQFNCQPELFCVKFLLSCLCHKADEIWEVNRCTIVTYFLLVLGLAVSAGV